MPVDYAVEDSVALLTLNRPEVLNAFDEEHGRALLEGLRKAAGDDSIRCIVILGAGRAFSAGEDLGALQGIYESGSAPPLGDTLVNRYNPLVLAVRSAPKPVVAAVNGVAAGAGASLALACDFRIASDKAKLSLAFIKVGLVPDSGGLWFLTRMVGVAKAWELAALGDPIDAAEALRLGIVNQVAAPEEFEAAWRAFAQRLAAGPTRAYALTKSLANAAPERSLAEQLELEVEAQTEAGKTQDHLEGIRAFLAKRAPDFKGR